MHALIRLIAPDMNLRRIFAVPGLHLDIFWNIDQHRARLSGLRNMKRHFQNPAQVFPLPDGYPVFGHRTGHADNVNFLKRIVANQAERHLPGNAYQRDAVIMGIRKPGNNIRRSRPARYQAYPGFSGRLCIPLRFKNQALFMPWQDALDILLFV